MIPRNSIISIIFFVCLALTAPGVQAAEPLVLQQIMKDLGKNMQDIADGISREDWDGVENTATLIADHPAPPLFEKVRILSFVGTNVRKYKAHNAATHDHAQALGKAAKAGDGTGAILAFQNLQTSCYNCHSEFRKPFVAHFYGNKDTLQ